MKLMHFVRVPSSTCRSGKILTIPVREIKTIESITGSERVYLVVNGIEVEGSYWDLIRELEAIQE